METKIIRTSKNDAIEFYNLEAICFDMEANDKDTLYYWVPILEYQCCFKAVNDSKIIGGIVAMPTFDKQWHINSLFVHPKHRMHGIAKALMKKVLDAAWYDEIILDVKTDRPYLIKFYETLGFKKIHHSRNHYLDNSDRFMMKRNA